MKMKLRYAVFVLIISFLLAVPSSYAAEEVKPPKLFSQFSEMQVTLSGPWDTIRRNKKKDEQEWKLFHSTWF